MTEALFSNLGDQTEDHLFVAADLGKGRKAAGALIVKFQIIGVDIFFAEQDIDHRVISAAVGIGGVEVASADMGVDDHAFRCAGDDLIVQVFVPLLHGNETFLRGAVEDVAGLVRHHAPGAVIELHIAAACIVELLKDFGVRMHPVFWTQGKT